MRLENEKKILDTIKKHSIIKVSSLEKIVKIPRTSLLRYLANMEQNGDIIKSFGEVQLRSSILESNPLPRLQTNKDIKIKIAKLAAKQIKNGDVIFLDGGSVTYYLAQELYDMNIKIYTNNIIISNLVSHDYKPIIHFVPGELNKTTLAISSSASILFINTLIFDKVFLGFNSYMEGWFATTNENESILKRTLIENNPNGKIFMIGESNKNDSRARYAFASKTNITLITEKGVQ